MRKLIWMLAALLALAPAAFAQTAQEMTDRCAFSSVGKKTLDRMTDGDYRTYWASSSNGSAYVEIEATYLVPPGSPLQRVEDVDRAGHRIAVAARSAYDLWLQRNIHHATLVHAEGFEATFDAFVDGGLEAMASLRPGLLPYLERLPGSRVLDGRFTAVQQSIGVRKGRAQAHAFLQQFVDEAKTSGLVAQLIARHSVKGLTVAA